MRVDLPDGEWAEFCSPRKVSDRRRRAWMAAAADETAASADLPQIANPRFGEDGQPETITNPAHMNGHHMELQGRVLDTLIMCFLKSWSLSEPVSAEALDDLDTGSKDALLMAALPLVGDMMPDFGDNPADPKATSGGFMPPPQQSPVANGTSATVSNATTF